MDIFDAMRLLAQGKKIRFHDWPKDEYVYLNDKNIPVYNTNDKLKWIENVSSLFADNGGRQGWEEYVKPLTKQRFVKIVLWNPKTKKFASIDSDNGYPYEVDGNNAYDFKTNEKAKSYQRIFPEYKIGQLVSYLE